MSTNDTHIDRQQQFANNISFNSYEENERLQNVVEKKSNNWIQRDYKTFQSPDWEAKPMNYELFYRKGIDTSAEKKFALLVFVYGAPEYQNVDGLWTTDFVKARVPRIYHISDCCGGIFEEP